MVMNNIIAILISSLFCIMLQIWLPYFNLDSFKIGILLGLLTIWIYHLIELILDLFTNNNISGEKE